MVCPLPAYDVHVLRKFVKEGREMWGPAGDKRVLCGCVLNYSGAQFIVPVLGLNPIHSWYLCPIGDWVEDLHVSVVSIIALPRLWSDR